ncbi:MAG: DUF1554 domain-containing protein [Leptospira sp.]|nr:DUF1554 domain-containing protein [Leptospira sp.]
MNNAVFITFVLLCFSCAKREFSNSCDPASQDFTQILFIKAALNDKSSHCGINYTSAIPDIPSGVSATSGTNQNTVTWTNSTGATSYNLYWRNLSGVTKTNGIKISNVTSPYTHSNPINGTKLYYVVTAENSGAESGVSSEVSATSFCNPCKMFMTAATYDGNMGGFSGADSKCSSDANKPATGTYKALLVGAINRIACTTASCSGGVSEHTDWVMQSNRAYVRSDGTTAIGTTNVNGLMLAGHVDVTGGANTIWTGLNTATDYTTHPNEHCTNWTDNSGVAARRGSTGSIPVGLGGSVCSTVYSIVCVEQ